MTKTKLEQAWADIYANLIVEGEITFARVHKKYRTATRERLKELGREDLIQ